MRDLINKQLESDYNRKDIQKLNEWKENKYSIPIEISITQFPKKTTQTLPYSPKLNQPHEGSVTNKRHYVH